jgi:GT2 family glycosyltransferase
MLDVSVIVPTYSVREPLKRCLDSLVDQTLSPDRYEILVVNNGGLRHSGTFLQPLIHPYEGRVRLIEAKRNQGYGGGCRLGGEHAEGDLFVFHNDDSIADTAWLAQAVSEWKNTPDMGVVTCRIVDIGGPRVQHEGVTQVNPNGLFWQTGYGELDRPFSRGARKDLEFFSGCIWATPRAVWEEIGGLGKTYRPGYYEDTEYGLRCRQMGYRNRLLTTVTCAHEGSLTLGHGTLRYWTAFHRSRYLFLLRNRLPFRGIEIAAAEARWWWNNRAGENPGTCLLGFATLVPKIPGALLDRRRFRKRTLGC